MYFFSSKIVGRVADFGILLVVSLKRMSLSFSSVLTFKSSSNVALLRVFLNISFPCVKFAISSSSFSSVSGESETLT